MFYNKLGLNSLFLGVLVCMGTIVPIHAAPVSVVAVTQDFASIAESIGGELVSVQSLVKGSRDLHNIIAKPSMVTKLRHADLLIRLGMGQDSWVDGLIQVARNPALFHGGNGYLDCSVAIDKLEVPAGKLDGSMGDVHIHGNPHYWLNPLNGKVIAAQIRDYLTVLDPVNKSVYQKNYDIFSNKIDRRMTVWQSKMLVLKETRFVTYHSVWSYFFDGFGLRSLGQLEPLPGVPPTFKHLRQLREQAENASGDVVVITASFYPPAAGQRMAKDLASKFVMLPANVGDNGVASYIALFDNIVEKLSVD